MVTGSATRSSKTSVFPFTLLLDLSVTLSHVLVCVSGKLTTSVKTTIKVSQHIALFRRRSLSDVLIICRYYTATNNSCFSSRQIVSKIETRMIPVDILTKTCALIRKTHEMALWYKRATYRTYRPVDLGTINLRFSHLMLRHGCKMFVERQLNSSTF